MSGKRRTPEPTVGDVLSGKHRVSVSDILATILSAVTTFLILLALIGV